MSISGLYTARWTNEEGNPVLRMYEFERIRKTAYQMDFWLDQESSFLNCRMRIVNESSDVIPMYWWSNIAVPEYEGGRVIVPAEKAFTSVDGAVFKVDIPMVNGVDVTDYKRIPRSVDYFFEIPQELPKYIANVDNTGFGLLHMSTDRLRSRKLFSWGNQEASDRWQEFLTDRAGRYIEIQAGLGKTQYGCVPMAPNTAWEWMEQYGAVQVQKDVVQSTHAQRVSYLNEMILDRKRIEFMKSLLEKSRKQAKTKAELLSVGSGYGAFARNRRLSGHLEFCQNSEALEQWSRFFETSVLHCPDPSEIPDEFLIDESNIGQLEQSMEKENKNNWYAHYQLGIGYYMKGEYHKAERAFLRSDQLAPNAWACHGLSCICMITGRKAEASCYISRGIELKKTEISYLKEGFKILHQCGIYDDICRIYETLGMVEKNVSRLMYYYIHALHRLGQNKKAYELLEKDGGLELEDIREGEDSVAALWMELRGSLQMEKTEVPHQYNFNAF